MIARFFDTLLGLLKWPVAVGAVILVPGAFVATLELLGGIAKKPVALLPFVAGALIYVILWKVWFRRRSTGSFFSTLEHELTHALFALLTFHPVTGLRATFREGGHVQFRGRGNWLITISPYFFPTLSVVAMLALALVPVRHIRWLSVVLGATYAYTVISTWRETHVGQTDLKKTGFVFAGAFLPAANLMALGSVVGFAWAGGSGLAAFWGRAFRLTGELLGNLVPG